MNFPVWELGMGGGWLVALVSILHVFVSHFAVGGGLWLVVTEMRANRLGDADLLAFVKGHSSFFVLLTLVFGAISGVGIWTTIGLVSPQGTSALIRAWVWGWAIEWVFFLVEICAALVYYYGWRKLAPAVHERVGWIYFVSAWMSLAIINGIITFMLTPGGWLEDGGFWSGFFNPTYWPSVAIRSFGAVALAGLFTLAASARLPKGDLRLRTIRWNAGWVVAGVAGVLICARWYAASIGVWQENEALAGAIPILPIMADLFKVGLVVVLVIALLPLVIPRFWNTGLGVVLLLAALMTMGAGEFAREAGRKPFTIHGYLYANGMRVDQLDGFAESGMAAGTLWLSADADAEPEGFGRELFRAWCRPCHTLDHQYPLRPYLAHWNEETIASLMPRLEHMRALMPPWYGTEAENAALTAYLAGEKPAEPAALPEDPSAAGWQAFRVSCGLCHTPYGFRALAESFEGMDPEEIGDFLDESGDLLDEMPGYFGPDDQRESLIRFLHTVCDPAEAPDQEGSES